MVKITNNVHQFGYEPAEFLSKKLTFTDIVHPEDLDRIVKEMVAFLKNDIVYFEQDYRIFTKGGDIRWVYEKTILKTDDTGLPTLAKGYLLDITERKLAEQQLRESSEKYYQLFDKNKAIELLIDPNTQKIIKANGAAEIFYGYNEQEFKNLSISDINILSVDKIEAEIELALTEKRDYFNFRHQLKNGEIKDVCVYSGPIIMAGRKVLYSIIHDITDQRQAEKALLESEQKFRSFIETTSEGFLILTPQLDINFSNTAICQLAGYSLTEMQGKSVLVFVTSESRKQLRQQLIMARSHSHLAAELTLMHKNGHHVFIRYKATVMADGNGFFTYITDITERKLKEVELRTLNSAVKHSASSIIITDKNGIIEYVNPRFCVVTGYSEQEVIGQTPSLISTAKTRTELHTELWKTILAGDDWHGETYNCTKNGEFYWSMMSISPIRNENGEISQFVSVSQDITEHKSKHLKMEELALRDPLTGLANRRLFDDRLNQAIQIISYQNRNGIGIIMLDLDHFKDINDTYGHDVGDLILKEVARKLLLSTRKEDTVSRFGGDEFIILLQDVSKVSDAQRVAANILKTLSEPIDVGEHTFSITCSLGVCLAPQDGCIPTQLLKAADLALYQAKIAGRNNIQFYNTGMQQLSESNKHSEQLISS
ncbi:sensor domain-containing protein [Colwellia psychrerythraea]|uniref:Sensory box/GGDEF domain protein n=1 Tax=Colwellia psychrerythraea (strain 34H / ATCC BAA-681) TaxID=167879 RepID=Q483T7_COLP3|nr:sensor domain-containing diguanylate cyclase [Colwellia psychrerythraea]AAZ24158.1 sensory box/GGDEF domain protein [Colwellia psychrerythraea 34H]